MKNVLFLLLLLPALWPQLALGHGGLPVTSEILWRGDTLYVPTLYWGIFVGTDGGPWHWICDEAINGNKLRQVQMTGDGTFYATDLAGLTRSRDGGCTWEMVPGGLTNLAVDAVVPDPSRPTRIYALTGRGGLWSIDGNGSPQQLAGVPDLLLRGLAVAADGQLVLCATPLGIMQVPTLYTAPPDGTTFSPHPVSPLPQGVPSERVGILGLDPRNPQTVYLRFQGDTTQVLVRADLGSGGATELLRLDNPIFDVSIDMPRDRLLISTGNGLYVAQGKDAPLRMGGLSRAQCTSVRNGKIYACSWDYFPDMAAVAHSLDSGQSFQKVFQFADTVAIMDCPAGTTSAQICPSSWATNAPLLGIGVQQAQPDMGGPDQPTQSHGCSAVRLQGRGVPGTVAWPALCLLLFSLLLRAYSSVVGRDARHSLGRGRTDRCSRRSRVRGISFRPLSRRGSPAGKAALIAAAMLEK